MTWGCSGPRKGSLWERLIPKKEFTLIKRISCAQCSAFLSSIEFSFIYLPHSTPMRQACLPFPFAWWRYWGSGKLNDVADLGSNAGLPDSQAWHLNHHPVLLWSYPSPLWIWQQGMPLLSSPPWNQVSFLFPPSPFFLSVYSHFPLRRHSNSSSSAEWFGGPLLGTLSPPQLCHWNEEFRAAP